MLLTETCYHSRLYSKYVKMFENSCFGSLTEKRIRWLTPSVLKLGFQEIITDFFYIIFQNLMFDVGLLFGMLGLSSFDQSCHFVLQLSLLCPVPSVFEFSIESFHLKSGICPKLRKMKAETAQVSSTFPWWDGNFDILHFFR